MICDICGSDNTKVVDTRQYNEYRRRRHYCNDCGCRFTTYEISADEFERLMEEKKDEKYAD